MFRQWSVIFKDSTETEAHKTSIPVQVMIALNDSIKILKLCNRQSWQIEITQRWHQRYAILSIFKYKLTAVDVLSPACILEFWYFYVFKTRVRTSSTWNGVLDLCSFFFIKKTPWGWNSGAGSFDVDIYHEFYFIICIILSLTEDICWLINWRV